MPAASEMPGAGYIVVPRPGTSRYASGIRTGAQDADLNQLLCRTRNSEFVDAVLGMHADSYIAVAVTPNTEVCKEMLVSTDSMYLDDDTALLEEIQESIYTAVDDLLTAISYICGGGGRDV